MHHCGTDLEYGNPTGLAACHSLICYAAHPSLQDLLPQLIHARKTNSGVDSSTLFRCSILTSHSFAAGPYCRILALILVLISTVALLIPLALVLFLETDCSTCLLYLILPLTHLWRTTYFGALVLWYQIMVFNANNTYCSKFWNPKLTTP